MRLVDIFESVPKNKKPYETKKNQGLSRAWIRCPSGRRLDLLDPSPVDVEISDIALSLSRISRWAGMTATDYGFSVAQHSVLVTDILEWKINEAGAYQDDIEKSNLSAREWLLASLCHDAPEGYLGGDLCGPAKAAMVNDDYRNMEKRLEAAIHIRFGLPAILPLELHHAIKDADRASAYAEAVLIAGFSKKEADPLFGIATPLKENATLVPWSPKVSEKAFIDKFNQLYNCK
ncbi:MAG: hydrolase [Alphaproteobacteria bacterium]